MINPEFKRKAKDLVAKMTLDEKISQLTHRSDRIERLGIPAFNWWSEAAHGSAWSGDASLFPHAIAMAATFNKELTEKVGVAVSTEVRAKFNECAKENGDTSFFEGVALCTPNINLARDPRWGRTQETYGEDPYLTGVMASAYIKGLQGDGKYLRTAATLKHFAVHSGPEKERHAFSAYVSDEDLYDSYLAAFRYCIEHNDIHLLMPAYSGINGVPCIANKRLLVDIARDEFGFDGMIDSDDGSMGDLINGYHLCNDTTEAAAMALNAGCDLEIGSGAFTLLKDALERGLVTEERITEACERVFATRIALGTLSDDCEYAKIPYDAVRSKEHKALNLKAAEEAIVLLKNNGILPLKEDGGSIAVIGPNADSLDALRGNFSPHPSEYTTYLSGIRKATERKVYWSYGCRPDDPAEHQWRENYYRSAVMAARRADVVILCLGLDMTNEGEFNDRPNISIELPAAQKKLFDLVMAEGKPTILVNTSGSCVALGEADARCDAVIQCFYPGECGGTALANILFGKVSPSGRLPLTFYASDEDLPPFTEYSMENRTYKFFKGTPVYPFGHGLSYTTFAYEDISYGDHTVSVTVKNTGDMDSMHTVLLFGKRKVKELVGFEKVFVEKGKSLRVTIAYEGDCTDFSVE